MKKLRCSRCGNDITINEHTQNVRYCIITGQPTILHFCNRCIEIIKNGDE